MSEEETTTAEETTEDKPKSKKESLVDEAKSAAERLEKATEAQKLENDRTERLQAKKILGGETDGAPQKVEPEKISPIEFTKKAMEGKHTMEELIKL